MTEPVLIKIACVVGAVIAYGLLRWRLMQATHEFRIRAGCEADRLVEDPRVHPRARASLSGLADLVYRPAAPWILLILLVVAMFLPARKLRGVRPSDDAETAAKIALLNTKLVFSSITTSPLACVLAIVVLAMGLLARSSVGAVEDRVSTLNINAGLFPNSGAGYSRSA